MSRLKGVLIASVAVNLFALGAIASFFLSRPSGPPPFGAGMIDPIRGPLLGPMDVDRVLSPEGLKVRDQVMPLAQPRFHQAVEGLFDARVKVLEIAGAPTLDRVALEKALNEMQEADDALTKLGQEVILNLLTSLSNEDRIAVAEAARKRQRERPVMTPPPSAGRGE
jgi:uncharacterized membrane protein